MCVCVCVFAHPADDSPLMVFIRVNVEHRPTTTQPMLTLLATYYPLAHVCLPERKCECVRVRMCAHVCVSPHVNVCECACVKCACVCVRAELFVVSLAVV